MLSKISQERASARKVTTETENGVRITCGEIPMSIRIAMSRALDKGKERKMKKMRRGWVDPDFVVLTAFLLFIAIVGAIALVSIDAGPTKHDNRFIRELLELCSRREVPVKVECEISGDSGGVMVLVVGRPEGARTSEEDQQLLELLREQVRKELGD